MTVSLGIDRGVAVVRICNPPVNALSLAVRAELLKVFTRVARDSAIRAVVLCGAGRGFCAGGDIGELGAPAAFAEPRLSEHVHPAIEGCGKPVVAALQGFAIGGGLETALACNYRVATADTRIALPEGRLGVVPLSGSQRLPRLIGLQRSLDLILSGDAWPAAELAETRLIDRVASGQEILVVAIDLARAAAERGGRHPLARDLPSPVDGAAEMLARARARIMRADAPSIALSLIDCLAAAVEAPDFDEGLRRARVIHDALARARSARVAAEQRA